MNTNVSNDPNQSLVSLTPGAPLSAPPPTVDPPPDVGSTPSTITGLSTINPQQSTNSQPSTSCNSFSPDPDEPPNAFAAFLDYFQLGPHRTLSEVARRTDQSLGSIKRWAAKYSWRRRVQQYHARVMQERMATYSRVQLEAVADWSQRSSQFREHEWSIANELLLTTRASLVSLQGRDPDRMSYVEIAKTLDIAAKMARRAAGMAAEKTEVTGQDGGPINLQFLTALEKTHGVPPTPTTPHEPQTTNNQQQTTNRFGFPRVAP